MFPTALLTVTGVTFLFFLLFRFRKRMAALVAWIVGMFISEPPSNQNTLDSLKSTNRKTKKNKSPKQTEELNSEQQITEFIEDSTKLSKNTKKSTVTKYQAVIQQTRKRSLDFDILVDKLEKVVETDSKVTDINPTDTTDKAPSPKSQEKKKKKAQKKSPLNEDKTKLPQSPETGSTGSREDQETAEEWQEVTRSRKKSPPLPKSENSPKVQKHKGRESQQDTRKSPEVIRKPQELFGNKRKSPESQTFAVPSSKQTQEYNKQSHQERKAWTSIKLETSGESGETSTKSKESEAIIKKSYWAERSEAKSQEVFREKSISPPKQLKSTSVVQQSEERSQEAFTVKTDTQEKEDTKLNKTQVVQSFVKPQRSRENSPNLQQTTASNGIESVIKHNKTEEISKEKFVTEHKKETREVSNLQNTNTENIATTSIKEDTEKLIEKEKEGTELSQELIKDIEEARQFLSEYDISKKIDAIVSEQKEITEHFTKGTHVTVEQILKEIREPERKVKNLDTLPQSSIIEHYKIKSKSVDILDDSSSSNSVATEYTIHSSIVTESKSQKEDIESRVKEDKIVITESSKATAEVCKSITEEDKLQFEEDILIQTNTEDNIKAIDNKVGTEDKSEIIEEHKLKTEYIIIKTEENDTTKIKGSRVITVDISKTEDIEVKAEDNKIETQNNKTKIVENEVIIEEQEARTKVEDTLKSDINIIETEIKRRKTRTAQVERKSESLEMKVASQIRVLTLNDNEHQDCTVYRLEKNWILEFRLGPSLLGRKVSLYCNYPETKDGKIVEFDRDRYYHLSWSQDEGCCHADDTALYAKLTIRIAGSFHYYFIYENATESGPHGSGYFLVDPILKYGVNEELPLNCIQCQTVLSKCLGPFSTWENKLRVGKESGYNMIHFTPVQELGKSHSAYSLSAQLKLNPTFNDGNTKITFTDLEKLMAKLRTEWKVLSICDIVLNHTANETDWLQEHPEGTYNCLSCPYMRPAYLLDAALNQFSEDVKNDLFETWGIPTEVCTEDHLNAIRHALNTKVLPDINIPEMFICDVNKLVSEFLNLARKTPPTAQLANQEQQLKLIRDPMYRRMATRVDMDLAVKLYNVYRSDSFDEETRIKCCSEEFKNQLDGLNREITDQLNIHLNAAVENLIAGIRYFRVQHDGPRVKDISVKNPLSFRYFTDYGTPKSIKEYEELMYGPNSKYLMAHNGWVMNADPMKNFADSDSNVYIRRELIAWGDSVKLRFGDKPEDCPFLWNHMKLYVEQTAKVFDGVRLDNCHSTPLHVAEYLLDCARRVRPDLYVVAELFTNSDHTDNVFVNRLGISSLIREAMSAWDSHEEGRLVYRYGGDPVGAFYQPYFRPLVPSIAHALFLDLTHDNPCPVQKRSVFDLLPSAALVNMACCASGSNRGYDELVNHHIHVVDEDRQYTEWTNDEALVAKNSRYVSYKSGIISAKRAINDLHFKLGVEGFNQVYVDQMDTDIVAVTRHRPDTHQTVVLVAFTAFGHPNMDAANHQRDIKPLRIEGVLDEIVLEATLNHVNVKKDGSKYAHPENFVQDKRYINGLSEYQVDIKQHIQLVNSDVFELGDSGNPNITQLNFKNFKPGSVVAVKVSLPKNVQQSVNKIRELMLSFRQKNSSDLSNVISQLNLADLNRALYRCDQEERDEGKGFGAYHIPNFGSLVYCGFQGFMSLLSTIRPANDLGHPMCGNLRDGNWMLDYICQRLKVDDGTKHLGQWLEKNTEPLKDIPRYLIPSYFDVIVTGIYVLLLEQSYKLMSEFVRNGSTFVKGLSLGSLQFAAVIKSADLPALSPNLAPPKPPSKPNDQGQLVQACVTLSAGLPHFSTGYMRNWGRDTFIALRGLFILTGRFQDARYHILGYAACLRHGLVPNLLDGGRNSRFNCRDAVWWWLYCIKSYVEEVPNGIEILSDKVSRIFPTDDSPALQAGAVDQPLCDVIQEALNIHFQGLAFRERNAGTQIDAHMIDKGFNNQIGIHPETGFVFGGNDANCGTWMDKMGSSDKASNRGKPATPRDGSAIELVGLSKAVVTWLHNLHQAKHYPHDGVERKSKNGSVTKWTFKQWGEIIQDNFEKYFWVNTGPVQGEIRPDLINKRGIYKDSFGATQEWADFQLRCNFPIAMVAAPEMFDPKHAWTALQQAEKYLLGPLGMKTLDPDDWAYCGDYNNADDSNNLKVANGFNYHQGPEWVWPVGYYLRAKLHFAAKNGELNRTVANVKVVLSKHFTELQTSAWRGLPELTNSNGSFCNDSSRTQAWSMACILEVLHDLQQIESKLQLNSLN